MKYLITGGAGFIGSHLAERLIEQGHHVAVLDDLSTGSLKNLRSLVENDRFRFVHGSVESNSDLGALMAWAQTVFHLAAAVGVDLVVRNPVRTIETNVHGTENVFRYASVTGSKVILASTSEVYGRAVNPVFSEEDDLLIGPPTHSRWSYAASKALDEFLALAYHREKQLETIIVRFFNTVGPRQTGRYGMVLPRFVAAALAGEPLRVFGDGDQTRCFCHVADTVRALLALDQASEANGGIYNIGTCEKVSINELAARVIELTGSASVIQHVPYDQAYEPGFEDMRHRMPTTARLHALTGWKPEKVLTETILEVKQYLEQTTANDTESTAARSGNNS